MNQSSFLKTWETVEKGYNLEVGFWQLTLEQPDRIATRMMQHMTSPPRSSHSQNRYHRTEMLVILLNQMEDCHAKLQVALAPSAYFPLRRVVVQGVHLLKEEARSELSRQGWHRKALLQQVLELD